MEIHPLIRYRSNPRAFATRPVEPEVLKRVLEAARWAPSSFNEQPWHFLVADAGDPEWLARLQGYLSPGNAWARAAPVLIASAYRTHFTHNEKPNPSALRDLGAAEQNLFLQACTEGLVMHQLGGFDQKRLKQDLLPQGFEPGTMAAIGYPNESAESTADPKTSEREPRARKPLSEFVFGAAWGVAAEFLSD